MIVPTTDGKRFLIFLRTGEKWQLGSAKRDNGLLMAIAVNDRKIPDSNRLWLGGVLPDGTQPHYSQKITPAF